MEEEALKRQLCTVDGSLLFLGLLLLSVGLSYWGVSLQREGLCRTLRSGAEGAANLPEVFPIRLWASALVVGCLGFFLCLAVRTAREAGDGAGAASARTNLHASVLVFLAALLRLDDLLKNAPRPECRAGGRLCTGVVQQLLVVLRGIQVGKGPVIHPGTGVEPGAAQLGEEALHPELPRR